MKAKFTTVYGLAVVEKDALFLRSFYLPFSRTVFARVGYELLWIVAFVFQFFRDDPRNMWAWWGELCLWCFAYQTCMMCFLKGVVQHAFRFSR